MATVTRGELFPRGFLHIPALLASGDQMSQAEFHRRYEQYPESIKFELINGTVYMASPQRIPHSTYEIQLSTLLGLYWLSTPGVQPAHNQTVILGPMSEPQPDLLLRVLPELGGNTTTQDEYVYGGPELIIEIAHSTVAIDLHQKKDDYERCGVAEYVVVCLHERQVCWFDLARGKARKIPSDGILRSTRFPGLWIDTHALFDGDSKRVVQVLNDGLASQEHARFVKRLANAANTEDQRKKRGTK